MILLPSEKTVFLADPDRARVFVAPKRARVGFTKVARRVNRNSDHLVFSRELVAHMEFAPLPTTARCARSLTRSMLGQWGMPGDTIETAELLVSELVTNAVRFTAHAECITLTLRSLPRRIVIEVADADSNPPFLADADVEAESGRGLMLVQALSKEWSYLLPPSGGKIVYCVIDSDPG